ncbi:ABC transporter ATP-binding protein [Breznakia pachnodae]|uniref:ATP-binding cassette subfamily B protein n=1 Tax=Breznakia pachnodae TaxID=265178 RepID=A0ABU0E5I5_9FIRM|nr:ABC transporter ATP-binding protein [Breznakia pachnodae]MDQ0362157.1 ATP-binding cassette subfamily B protein [Breznakia pachnodae]
MMKLISRILAVAGKYQRNIRLAFLFSFLKSMFAKAPIGLGFIALTAFYNNTMTTDLCIIIGAGMLLSIVLQALSQNIADRLQSASGYWIFSDMRMDLGAHLRKMPMGYFTEGNIGKISSVLSTDMVFIEENCMSVIADMMSHIFSEIIMIIFMFFINIYLGIVTTIIVVVIILIAKGMERDALKDSSIRQNQSETLTDAVLDFVEGIGIIKTYNLLGDKSKELSDNFKETCRVSIQFEENHTPWQRILNIIYGMGAVIILSLSLYLYSQDMMEVPYLIGVLLFVFDLLGPIKALYSQSTRLTVMNSCMDRIEEVFQEQQLSDNGKDILPETYDGAEVQFDDVSFAYDEKVVLHNISFNLDKNNMLALVGPSGGGKSTIASLLTRFWDVNKGKIQIRGKDIRDIKLSQLMDQISVVFQRVYLFQDTIYNNISMGRPDASEEEVMEAAKKARCYDFIMSLPEGFQTIIGEGGATLSGGEKQRISIARCILKDAPIIILDEATASVDADNESYIQEAISELCVGKTLIVIAHRLNTIRNADKILVIAGGEIAQSGTHDELVKEDGIYKEFVSVRENTQGWNRNLKNQSA